MPIIFWHGQSQSEPEPQGPTILSSSLPLTPNTNNILALPSFTYNRENTPSLQNFLSQQHFLSMYSISILKVNRLFRRNRRTLVFLKIIHLITPNCPVRATGLRQHHHRHSLTPLCWETSFHLVTGSNGGIERPFPKEPI